MTSFNPAASTDPVASAPVAPPATAPAATAVKIEYNGRTLTHEEVLTKITHADAHIARLEAERKEDARLLAEANAALAKAVTLKEALASPATVPAAVPSAPVDVAAEVGKALDARETRKLEESNWKAAQDAMTKAFGKDADAKAREMAASIGMSFEDVVGMARTKPLAFQRLFPELGKSVAPAAPHTPGKSVNAAAMVPPTAKTSSGYWESAKAADRTAAYLKRLNELSGA